MLKIGIIGCGRIAEQHALEIKALGGCEIVGVCDKEFLMAKQFGERTGSKKYFKDIDALLNSEKPDIVHITTPPQSHFRIGKKCLESDCNVFIEKPFTLNSTEAQKLIHLAENRRLKLTVGHNAQFSHAAIRMREMIKKGFLGGKPVHMESIWCYSFKNQGYAKAILGDKNHWIRSLPGKYLQDIISHGICRIAEYLDTDDPIVVTKGHVSPTLKKIGENEIIDELRVIIDDRKNTTAYYTFSSQIYPPIKQFRIYGPNNSLTIDNEHQTVIETPNNKKLYLNHFIPPLIDAKKYISNSFRNMINFIRREHYFEYGRRYLIKLFYESVAEQKPLPIPYHEILLTTRIMDTIFDQLNTSKNL